MTVMEKHKFSGVNKDDGIDDSFFGKLTLEKNDWCHDPRL